MAGQSMKDIKTRIKSVESTMQITKALELVATSKLRGARERVEKSRPFFKILQDTISEIISNNKEFSSVYTKRRDSKNICCIVIAGDRGLAGGYNNNIYKETLQILSENTTILPLGKKANEYYAYHKKEIFSDEYKSVANMKMDDCHNIALSVAKAFSKGEIDEVYLVYTKFVSMLSQEPQVVQLLPFIAEGTASEKSRELTIYEPSAESVFDNLVLQYIAGTLYGAISESLASELSARRIAMESANDNASEIIDNLSLKYNRARQGAITQELTEMMSSHM